METLSQILFKLETRLMEAEVRRSPEAADMLAEDFTEFGSNGRLYNKSDAVAMMRHHSPRVYALEEFHVRELAPGIALVTYVLQSQAVDGGPGRNSARSSLWVQNDGKWQVTFHQVTML